MGTGEQLVTIAAVLLGALTTHLTNYAMERSRHQRELVTRWDNRKLDAYGGYVDRVRAGIFLAVQLYEHREGLRRSEHSEVEMVAEMAEAERYRGRAFEQVMLLGGDDVVEAAHELNAATVAIEWQATGKTVGTLEEWRERNRAGFRGINAFHEAARVDLGVQGNVSGEKHPERDLLLPAARREDDGQAT
ncbi:hypothetical protein [Streptomyces sp. AK02-01A]|uniref:hypothetical protein n=1 Tax=Streptomyces sp. AK02-01A TaxID=3028648 RepID=UPI0029B8F397|nr:hypothetical protein [Streptomyces sp. AK02-01A]MDX3855052.1 hypothetical protein [Streptomyces sp. AK02-01A]